MRALAVRVSLLLDLVLPSSRSSGVACGPAKPPPSVDPRLDRHPARRPRRALRLRARRRRPFLDQLRAGRDRLRAHLHVLPVDAGRAHDDADRALPGPARRRRRRSSALRRRCRCLPSGMTARRLPDPRALLSRAGSASASASTAASTSSAATTRPRRPASTSQRGAQAASTAQRPFFPLLPPVRRAQRGDGDGHARRSIRRPPPFQDMFLPGARRGRLPKLAPDVLWKSREPAEARSEIEALVALYDGGIRHVDTRLEEAFAWLAAAGSARATRS